MRRISPAPTCKSSGFTLVETLVALVILGFTLAVLSQSVWVMLRTEQRLLDIRRAALATERLQVGWILDAERDVPEDIRARWNVEIRDVADDNATPQPRSWKLYQLEGRESSGQRDASIARLLDSEPIEF